MKLKRIAVIAAAIIASLVPLVALSGGSSSPAGASVIPAEY